MIILFVMNEDDLDERVRLTVNRTDCPLDFLTRPMHRNENRDDAVSTGSAACDKAAAIGEPDPGFEKNEKCSERSKPADEEQDELKQGAHTSLLIYL